MSKTDRLTVSDIGQWIDNDEGLYSWWKSSRQNKRLFIRENRAELESCIRKVLFAPPRPKQWYDY